MYVLHITGGCGFLSFGVFFHTQPTKLREHRPWPGKPNKAVVSPGAAGGAAK